MMKSDPKKGYWIAVCVNAWISIGERGSNGCPSPTTCPTNPGGLHPAFAEFQNLQDFKADMKTILHSARVRLSHSVRHIAIAVACLSLFACGVELPSANAQQGSARPMEFIESTSPHRYGGTVTVRSTPDGRVESRTQIAQLPVREGNSSSVLTGPSSPQSVYRVPQSTGTTSTAGTASYPYPNTQTPQAGYVVGQGNYAGSNSLATTPGAGTVYTPHVAYQGNTLGLPPVRPAVPACPPCDCTPGAAAAPPNLTFNVPGQTPQPGVLQTNPAYTNYGYQAPVYNPTQGGFWQPFFTGSGAYQPLIRLQNLPPGTYLGQGIIGQPTAYVDGQPVRNLLRYIFP